MTDTCRYGIDPFPAWLVDAMTAGRVEMEVGGLRVLTRSGWVDAERRTHVIERKPDGALVVRDA